MEQEEHRRREEQDRRMKEEWERSRMAGNTPAKGRHERGRVYTLRPKRQETRCYVGAQHTSIKTDRLENTCRALGHKVSENSPHLPHLPLPRYQPLCAKAVRRCASQKGGWGIVFTNADSQGSGGKAV